MAHAELCLSHAPCLLILTLVGNVNSSTLKVTGTAENHKDIKYILTCVL